MTDAWAKAQEHLVAALEAAKRAGIDASEAMSAVDDVYFENSATYVPQVSSGQAEP